MLEGTRLGIQSQLEVSESGLEDDALVTQTRSALCMSTHYRKRVTAKVGNAQPMSSLCSAIAPWCKSRNHQYRDCIIM